MPLVKCPDCGKDISQEATICIGCGRPMKQSTGTPNTDSPSYHTTSPTEIVSAPLYYQEGGGPTVASRTVSEKVKKSRWSWKSFAIAVAVAFVMTIVAAGATNGQAPKNMIWTVMWLYLTIEGWNYWKWKALIPYPIFILASGLLTLVMGGDNPHNISLTYAVMKVGLNIGGLIVFYTALHKAKSSN